MSSGDEVLFPPDQRVPRWYADSPVMVRWDARRELEFAIVSAVGTIMVARDEGVEEDGDRDEDACYVKAGEIRICKPSLGEADALMEMDALSGDHEYLASAVLDGAGYDVGFEDWLEAEFGMMVGGDPIFVLDLTLGEEHRDPEAVVASHAALDALAIFGSTTSPLVTFDLEKVDSGLRPGQRGEGVWTWVHALRAKHWKHVYITVRP